jgi:DNA-binding transcriptional ArsR family regulator
MGYFVPCTAEGGFRISKLKHINLLADLVTVDKLLWSYLISEGEGEYTVQFLTDHLGLSSRSVRVGLNTLKAVGLLEVLDPGGPRRPQRLQAVIPEQRIERPT